MNLEKMVRDHAHWADKVRELKRQGESAASNCVRNRAASWMSMDERLRTSLAGNCIEATYQDWKANADPAEYGGTEQSFEEWWAEARASGTACDNCQRVRDLRAERMLARKRLGAVRAAITRVGRTLPEQREGGV